MDDIANLISTVGFPIVVAIVLMFHSFSISDNFQKVISQNTETLKILIATLESKNIHIMGEELKDDNDTNNGEATTNDNTNNGQANNDK